MSLPLQLTSLITLRIMRPTMPRPLRIPGGLPGVVLVAMLPALIILLAVVSPFRARA